MIRRRAPQFLPFLQLRPVLPAVALLVIFPLTLRAADPITPPFGLKLGSPMGRVEKEIASAGLRVTSKSSSEGSTAWTLSGFNQENLTAIRLHFDSKSRLREVELQYGNPAWSSKQFDGFADFFLRNLQRDLGPPVPVEKKSEIQGGVEMILECHQWRRDRIRLRCVRFSARSIPAPTSSKSKSKKSTSSGSQHFDTISLHYRLMPK